MNLINIEEPNKPETTVKNVLELTSGQQTLVCSLKIDDKVIFVRRFK